MIETSVDPDLLIIIVLPGLALGLATVPENITTVDGFCCFRQSCHICADKVNP